MKIVLTLAIMALLSGCAQRSEDNNAFWRQASPAIGQLIK